jgi:hypothetical protein
MSMNGKRRLLAGAAATGFALAALLPAATMAQDASAAPLPALPAPEKTTINIGLSVAETSQYATKLAEQAGFWQALGITPTITVFEGDGKTLQALQAGQLDIGFIGTSSAINSQVTDAPVVILSTNATILSDYLLAVPDVHNADELRGKCVAISTFGGTSNGAALLGLQAIGLTPADVVITEIGGQSARIAALEGGACQAAPTDASVAGELIDKGYNVLADLKAERLGWGRSGMAVTKEWLAANPNTALNALAATLQGQNFMWTNPEEAAAFYDEFTQMGDLEKAAGLIADFQEIGNRSMQWTDDAFENPKSVLAIVNPDVAGVDVTTAYDRSFLQQLVDMGYYEALGIPAE